MKKEGFPTFLNEQPTVVFGRTMRELLVFIIGMALAYIVWTGIDAILPASNIGVILLNVLCSITILAGFVLVAFVKIASRPLEEWGLVGIFYFFTPKLFIYMPAAEKEAEEIESDLLLYQQGGHNADEDKNDAELD